MNTNPHSVSRSVASASQTSAHHPWAFILLAACAALLSAVTARAASETWLGTPTDATWGNTANWSNTIAPGATGGSTTNTDTATFSATVTNGDGTTTAVSIDSGRNIDNITFTSAAASAYVIGTTGGSPLLLTNNGTIQTATTVANIETINAPLTIEPTTASTSGTYTISSNSSTAADVLNIGGAVSYAGTGGTYDVLNLNGSNIGNNDLSGTITDTNTKGLLIQKSGAGAWTLGGNGSSTLAVGSIDLLTSNSGTFNFGSVSEAPTLTITTFATGNVTVDISGNNTFNMVNGTLNANSGVYGLVMEGSTTGSQTYNQTGGMFSSTSTLDFANSSGTSNVNVSGGNLTTTSGNGTDAVDLAVRGTTIVTLSGAGAITTPILNMTTNQTSQGAPTSTFNLNGGTLTTGQIIKGSATTAVSETFNFNGGTLTAVSNAGNSTFLTGLTIANVRNGGAIINTGANSITIGQALVHSTIGGDLATDGGLTKQGPGTLTLSNSNTYTGATLVSSGTLALTGTLTATSGVTVNGAAANFNDSSTNGLTGATSLTVTSGSAILSGANNFSGATNVTGLLQLSNGGAIASSGLTLNGGSTLQLLNNTANTTFTDTSTTISGNTSIFVDHSSANTGNTLLLGAISMGANTVTLTNGDSYNLSVGTVTASAGPTFTNNMTSGTLTLGALTSTDASPTTAMFAGTSASAITSVGAITQPGGGALAVTQAGSGTLLVTGANAYTGATSVTNGILKLGSAGSLGNGTNNTSGVTVSSGAELDLGGQTPTANVSLTLNGTGISSAGALINSSAAAAIYGGALTLGSATVSINSNSGDIVFSSATPVSFNDLSAAINLNLGGTDVGGSDIKSGFSDSVGGTNFGLYINKSGAGTWTLGGNGVTSLTRATITIAAGILNFGSASESPSFTTTVNGAASSNAAINLNGGTLNIYGGTLNMISTAGQALYDIGGNINIYGGTVTMVASQGLVLNGSQTYAQTSGTFTTNGRIEFSNGGGASIVNVSGGLLTTSVGSGIETVRGTTTITLSSSGMITTPLLDMTTTQLSGGSAATIFNLNGGTLTVGQITQGTNGTTGSAFNFNGGTLVASAGGSTFMTGITAANVLGGGAMINTGVNAITIGQALLHGSGTPDGGLTKLGTGMLTLSNSNTYTGATLVSSGTLALTGTLTATSGVTVSGAAANFNDSSTNGLTGATSLTVTSGSAILSGANNFSGATNVTGLLQLSNGGAIASSALTLNGGSTLQLLNNTANTTFTDTSTTISGNTSIFVDHSSANTGNTLILGAISMGGNTVTVTNGDSYSLSLGTVTASAGPTFTNNMTSGTLTLGGLTLTAASPQTAMFNGSSATAVTSVGAITQNGGNALALTQAGLGTLIFTGANSYTGATTVSSGALNIQNAGALASTSGVSVSSGAALQMQTGIITSAATPLTLNGAGVTAFPNGAIENVTGANTYSGLITLGSNTTFGSDAGTLTLSNAGTITGSGYNLTLTGAGNGAISSIIGTGAGTLTKTGAGTWILTGGNTYTGLTTISVGTLQIGAGASGASNGSLAAAGSITDNAALVFDRADTVTQGIDFSSAGIGGTGSLTQLGTGALILNVANSYTGNTIISSGTLTLTAAGTLNNGSYAGNILNSGVFNYNSASAQTLSGVISNGGSLAKGGSYSNTGGAGAGLSIPAVASTLTLTGSNTYNGSTTVSVGTLQLAGASGALANTTGITVNGNANFIAGDITTASNNNSTANRINSAATLTLGGAAGGGTYTTAFGSSAGPSQTLASLTINAGGDLINTANTAAGTASLIFTGGGGGGYVRSIGGILNVQTATGFNPSFTNAPTAAGGSSISGAGANAILVGAILNGNDFVSAASGALTAAAYTANGASSLTTGGNITFSSNTTLAASSTVSVNSLQFNSSTQDTLALGTSSILTVASGGILTGSSETTANINPTISGGTITSGTDLWIFAGSGSPGGSNSNGNPRNQNSALTISSVIADNTAAGTTVALTVGGGEQVTLSGNNIYTGGTYLDNGFIIVNSNASLGNSAGTVTAVSGVNSINPTTSFTFNASRNFVINAGASLDFGDLGAPISVTVAGTVSGGGALESGFVSNGGRLILTGNNSSFTGQYVVDGFLNANEGVGLSTSANLVFVGRDSPAGSFNLGVLETSSNSFTRSVGMGADQVQWQNDSQFASGGFAAVGGSTLTVNLGGAGATLTYGQGGFISTQTNFTPSLILGDANSTAGVNFVNPLALAGGIRDFNVGSLAYSGTLSGVLSGNGSSGIQYGNTFGNTSGLLVLAGANTYAGTTSIVSGTLGVSSLNYVSSGNWANHSTGSSLGMPTTVGNGTIAIGSGAFTGALRYLGAGETTDRVIDLAGTTGGATIDQSGSGLLDFTHALTASGLGAKTLTLQGSTAGTGEIDGAIVDSTGGATSLSKSGTGTWTLTGANTYTGVTTVQAGTLIAGVSDNVGTNGPFGNASTAIVLGNGSTLAGDAPSLLAGAGATGYTVARNITVGSIADAGVAYKATIGGANTGGTSYFTGNITLNTTANSYTTTLQAATGGTVDFKTGTWTTNNKAITIGSTGNTGTVEVDNLLTTTGGLTVAQGTLKLGGASGTAGTGGTLGPATPVTVNSSGTLLLAAKNAIGSNSNVTLAGGAFNGTSGISDGAAATLSNGSYTNSTSALTNTLGAGSLSLTLSTNSTLDFASGSSGETLVFASFNFATNATLTIANWDNTNFNQFSNTSGASSDDRLVFDQNLNAAQLAEISFGAKPAGEVALGNGYYEIGAIPEPSTVFAALALFGFVGYRERKRLRGLFGNSPGVRRG